MDFACVNLHRAIGWNTAVLAQDLLVLADAHFELLLRPCLVAQPQLVSVLFHRLDRSILLIEIKQGSDGLCFRLHNLQRPAIRLVAERDTATHPQPLLLRGRNLVANAFGGDFPFELGKHCVGCLGGYSLTAPTPTKPGWSSMVAHRAFITRSQWVCRCQIIFIAATLPNRPYRFMRSTFLPSKRPIWVYSSEPSALPGKKGNPIRTLTT